MKYINEHLAVCRQIELAGEDGNFFVSWQEDKILTPNSQDMLPHARVGLMKIHCVLGLSEDGSNLELLLQYTIYLQLFYLFDPSEYHIILLKIKLQ